MKTTFKELINTFIANLEGCKVKFDRGSEVIEDNDITLYFKHKENDENASIEQLISNQLVCMGIETKYLPFSDDCHTWMLFGKTAADVWHVVVYKEAGKMIIQWNIITNQ
jgi:hypothetical protein